MNMKAFLNVLKKQIKKKNKGKEEYQEIVANWLYSGFLTDAEATEALALIEEMFPTTVEDSTTEQEDNETAE